MKKKNNYIKAIIISLFLLIALFTILIFFVYWMDKIQLGSKKNISVNYDWLSFLGNCISGFIGSAVPLCVMFYTIGKQKEDFKEEKRLQILPILEYKFVTDKEKLKDESISGINILLPDESVLGKDSHQSSIKIIIKNIGNGHARGIRFYKEIDGKYNSTSFETWEHERGILPIGKEKEWQYYFCIDPCVAKQEYNFEVKLHIFYQDCIQNTYEQVIDISVQQSTHTDENGKETKVDIAWVSKLHDERLVEGYPSE